MDILKLDEKNMNSEYSIFISYKRKDKEKVFVIKDYIERHTGKKCWIDLLGIESDELYTNVIIKAINKTKILKNIIILMLIFILALRIPPGI